MDIDAFLCGFAGQSEATDGVPSVSILVYLLLVERYDAGGAVAPVDREVFRCCGGIDAQVSTEGLDIGVLSDLCKFAGLDAALVCCRIAVDVRGLGGPLIILVDAVQSLILSIGSRVGVKSCCNP